MTAARSKCPICGKLSDPRASRHPFCSKRCRTQDLANWASGTYAIPAPVSEADEDLASRRDPDESLWDG